MLCTLRDSGRLCVILALAQWLSHSGGAAVARPRREGYPLRAPSPASLFDSPLYQPSQRHDRLRAAFQTRYKRLPPKGSRSRQLGAPNFSPDPAPDSPLHQPRQRSDRLRAAFQTAAGETRIFRHAQGVHGSHGKPRNQGAGESGSRKDRIAASAQTQADWLGTVEAKCFVGDRRGALRPAEDSRQRFGRAYEDAYSYDCPFRSAMPCRPRVRTPMPAPPSAPARYVGGAQGYPADALRSMRKAAA